MSTRQRRKKGSSLVETTVGLIVLIPVVLFLVDVAAMVIATTENDKLAKACARAAAEQSTASGQQAASANLVMANQTVSTLLQPQGNPVTSNPLVGMVRCQTTIKCNLPVPVPLTGPAFVMFTSVDTEPVVGELPQ